MTLDLIKRIELGQRITVAEAEALSAAVALVATLTDMLLLAEAKNRDLSERLDAAYTRIEELDDEPVGDEPGEDDPCDCAAW